MNTAFPRKVCYTSAIMSDIWDNHLLRRTYLPGLTVLEVWVCEGCSLLLLGQRWGAHCRQNTGWSTAIQKYKSRGPGFLGVLQGTCSLTQRPCTRLHPSKGSFLIVNASLGTNVKHTCLWGYLRCKLRQQGTTVRLKALSSWRLIFYRLSFH